MNRRAKRVLWTAAAIAAAVGLGAGPGRAEAKEVKLLNVSYDPTRELYEDVNAAFAAQWKAKTGEDVTIKQSHGGSGKQARSVHRRPRGRRGHAGAGLRHRRDRRRRGCSPPTGRSGCPRTPRPTPRPSSSWCARATRRASRTGTTWSSRASQVITPNPKTSGGARWNYLAAWALRAPQAGRRRGQGAGLREGALQERAVLDSGARGSTTTFVQRGIGDVLLAWENEALPGGRASSARASSRSSCPSISILAEPPVAVVDKIVDRHGTRAVGQGLPGVPLHAAGPGDRREALLPAARPEGRGEVRVHGSRRSSSSPSTRCSAAGRRPRPPHFGDGGVFDQIYTPGSFLRGQTHVQLMIPLLAAHRSPRTTLLAVGALAGAQEAWAAPRFCRRPPPPAPNPAPPRRRRGEGERGRPRPPWGRRGPTFWEAT